VDLSPAEVPRPAEYHEASRPELCDLISGIGLRVLDLGCGTGALGVELLRRGMALEVHGVEVEPGAAKVAATRLQRVVCATLDAGMPNELAPPYDVVVAADVLEHLREPAEILEQIRAVLTLGGRLIISVPNIRSLRVLGPLLVRGRFDYQPSGILDRSHLRFFTRSSLTAMLEDAGFAVEMVRRAPLGLPPQLAALGPPAQLIFGDLATSQLYVVAIPT
jgi:2-polyprenyl-3-methyl-5-hydroxy-6-metoxy-1,4-benzoquinol methylase